MMTSTLTLADFLRARLDEDEAAALAAHGRSGRWASWNRSWDTQRNRDLVDEDAGERMACIPMDLDEHIARHDPQRVLAEVAAQRAILDVLQAFESALGQQSNERTIGTVNGLRIAVKAMGAVYSDHPDYDERWRP